MRPRRIFRLVVTVVLLIILLSWCTADREAAFTVFFGRDISNDVGGETDTVSDEDWADFERTVVAPALGGYTVLEGRGGYLPENEESEENNVVVHEDTIILIYVTADDSASQEKIETVSSAYKERFSQQSVLIIKTDAEVLAGTGEDANGDGLFVRILALLVVIAVIGAVLFGRTSNRMWH